MEWLQVLTIISATVGSCWFFRKETKEEIGAMNAQMKSFQNEMTNFHGRLCTLEERYIQMMERFMEERRK